MRRIASRSPFLNADWNALIEESRCGNKHGALCDIVRSLVAFQLSYHDLTLAGQLTMSITTAGLGPLLPISLVCREVGSLSKTGPHVLVASLSHFDPQQTS